MTVAARRISDAPLIHSGMDQRMGTNINGPSLIRAPDWLENPLGRFLLYFADHRGKYIRLAYADHPEGPYEIHGPGCLDLADSHYPVERRFASGNLPSWASGPEDWYYPHIASPDVHVLEESRQIRMYLHGLLDNGDQATRVAHSSDGLNFTVMPELLGPPYFRAFSYAGSWYALALPNHVLRSGDGVSVFEQGPRPLPQATRHTAVLLRDDILHVFWSEIGDTPERIYHGRIDLATDWMNWTLEGRREILRPELDWEGAAEPLLPSVAGAADEPVHQLRDPCIFEDGGKTYLLYSAAGERAIGMAELMGL
ncbi:MAG: hypothetical protein AAF441_22130 [Pseudomonadota bacterium]